MKRRKPGAWPGGSSPRVRGTRGPQSHRGRHRRFIPACAGNTSNASSGVSNRSVHPRVCGEHEGLGQRAGAVDGSSPRVRGTPIIASPPTARRRFIPACAGNTQRGRISRARRTVHPRVCGEHLRDPFIFNETNGSSPRVRGTHRLRRGAVRRARFIPACAGNTLSGVGKYIGKYGSSPRVRGTRFCRSYHP